MRWRAEPREPVKIPRLDITGDIDITGGIGSDGTGGIVVARPILPGPEPVAHGAKLRYEQVESAKIAVAIQAALGREELSDVPQLSRLAVP